MQFADSASKFAFGAQFCKSKELQPLYYAYLKLELYTGSSKWAKPPRYNFLILLPSIVWLPLSTNPNGNMLPFATVPSPNVIWALLANCPSLIGYCTVWNSLLILLNLHVMFPYPWQFAERSQITFGAVAKGNRSYFWSLFMRNPRIVCNADHVSFIRLGEIDLNKIN